MHENQISCLYEFLNYNISNTDEVFDRFLALDWIGAVYREGTNPKERYLYLPGDRDDRVLLVAHADTVWDVEYGRHDIDEAVEASQLGAIEREQNLSATREHNPPAPKVPKGVMEGQIGADDRAGCAMLWLLKGIGHSLLLTDGEEKGQRGSVFLRDNNSELFDEIQDTHRFIVQLDRRNGSDFKCYNVGTSAFREYVMCKTGYSEPDKRSRTDILILCRDICGVNLSVGYHDEHKLYESIDIDQWLNSLIIVKDWLTTDELPRYMR